MIGTALLLGLSAWAQAGPVLRVYDAPDADQGVAVDGRYFYAVDNHVVAKHERGDGERIARWDGGEDGPIQHLNSCIVIEALLECANSNYPATPIASSLEYFDPTTLSHVASHSLGVTDEGSITWTDRVFGGRIAGFAHYGKKGGEPFKDNAYGSVVLFDEQWRRIGGYAFPPDIVARMAPYSASGGAIGPDGLLYILGHDLPEMYLFAKPVAGPYLRHVATLPIDAEGQAFGFEPGDERIVWVIDRRQHKIRRVRLAEADVPADLPRFR